MSQQAIPTDLITLIERLNGHETLELEVKRARGNAPASIWPTVSAFANTAGGRIILGINELADRWEVEGIPNAHHVMQQVADLSRNPQKIQPAPLGSNDLWIEEVDGKALVVVRVPPMPRTQRPVYIDGNPYTGTYLRRASGDYQCRREEVERMMREAADTAADHVVLDGFTWDDLDRRTFAAYRQRHQNNNPTSPDNDLDDAAFLAAIGGYRRDRQTGRAGITVAGLLMFGTGEAIRSWRPRHLIDYRSTEGNPEELADSRWLDRVTWENNLLGAFDTIFPKLTAGLAIPFELVDGVRRGESPRHEVLREALVNLLAHADYRERDASLVISSEQGFRFRNPGDSRVPDLDPMAGDRSDPRNPTLVRMFRLIGLADEAGTGIRKIIRVWRSLGRQAPAFELGTERYEFSVTMRNVDLLSAADRHWLDDLGHESAEAEQLALITARHSGAVDNATLRRLTGMHPTDVTRILGGLRGAGLLQLAGWGRAAHYVLTPALRGTRGGIGRDEASRHALDNRPSSVGPGSASSVGSAPSSVGPGSASSVGPAPSSVGASPMRFPASPASSVDSPSASIGRTLPPDYDLRADPIWPTLTALAGPVALETRTAAAERNDIIVELCAVRPLSINDLQALLDRNKRYLLTVLRELVDDGRLDYVYPDRPNHPYQRYVHRRVEPTMHVEQRQLPNLGRDIDQES